MAAVGTYPNTSRPMSSSQNHENRTAKYDSHPPTVMPVTSNSVAGHSADSPAPRMDTTMGMNTLGAA